MHHRPVRADRQSNLHRVADLVGVTPHQEANFADFLARFRLRHGYRKTRLPRGRPGPGELLFLRPGRGHPVQTQLRRARATWAFYDPAQYFSVERVAWP